MGFPSVVGDRTIAGGSGDNLRHGRLTSATASLRLCAFAPLRSYGTAGASALCFSGFRVRIGVLNLRLIGS